MKTRISIVEDDEPTRQILIRMVKGAPGLELAAHFDRSPAAVEALPALKPDVVLMDINMPELNGVECVRRLKPLMPATQFLMLTVYEDAEHIFGALAAGATGYLLKGTRRQELLSSINQITAGGSPMSSGIARKVVQHFAQARQTQAGVDALSPREHSVLTLLTKGYMYKEIADELGISVPTVDSHIRHIYEKLQVNSRSQAIVKFLGQAPK